MEPSEAPLSSLSKGLEVIKKKRKICKKNLEENIENIINVLQNTVEQISSVTSFEDESSTLNRKVTELSDQILEMKPLENTVKTHKDYYTYMSKFGKWTDKIFAKNINQIFTEQRLSKKIVNRAIYQHFVHTGNNKSSECFKQEANLIIHIPTEHNFQEVHKIIQDLKQHNIEFAIEWAQKHEAILQEMDSDLLFVLYQQKFIKEVISKDKKKAVEFVRENFNKFFPKYSSQIQRLMGSLLYDQVCENPRYADLFDQKKWGEISDNLLSMACKIYNVTKQSPLSVTLEAGTLALPQFIKYFSIANQNGSDDDEEDSLDIPINIGKDYCFHSNFICPIAKEPTTPDNPPMALDCGHVISSIASFSLRKLLNQSKTRHKCPYCPALISLKGSTKLYFE